MKIFISFTCVFLLISSMAYAGLPTVTQQKYMHAAKQMKTVIRKAEKLGDVRLLMKPDVSRWIQTMHSTGTIILKQSLTMDDFPALMEICSSAGGITTRLLGFGLRKALRKYAEKPKKEAIRKALKLVANRNIIRFDHYLVDIQPFAVRCQAKVIPLLWQFWSQLGPDQKTQIRRQGVRQAQRGVFATFISFPAVLNNDSFDGNYKIAVLIALADTADTYAAALPVSMRHKVAAIYKAAQKTDNVLLWLPLIKIENAFKKSGCKGLCTIENRHP